MRPLTTEGGSRAARFAFVVSLALACSKPSATATKDPAVTASTDAAPAVAASTSATAASVGSTTATTLLEVRLRARATAVLAALKTKDMKALAALVHPTQGVRFSPYPGVVLGPPPTDVRPDLWHPDLVLKPAEVERALRDPKTRVWGAHDGSGLPIEETFAKYYADFVWTKDFTVAPEVGVDRGVSSGFSNADAAYPNGHFVEFNFPPKTLQRTDWHSLRLIFEDALVDGGSEPMLVGIVHGQWTI